MEVQNLMRVQQAAAAAGLHPATIYKLIKAGRITKYAPQLGRATYVDLNELTALLNIEAVTKEV